MNILPGVGCGELRYRLSLIMLVLLVPALSQAGTLTLDDLLARLAPPDGEFRSDYLRTRESGLLDEAVTVEGRIEYRSPRHLREMRVHANEPQTLIIDDDTVRIERADDSRSFPLARAPELQALMRLLEAVATADANALQEHFFVQVSGSEEAWRLALESRMLVHGSGGGRDGKPVVLRVSGERGRVREIVMEAPGRGSVTIELTGNGR